MIAPDATITLDFALSRLTGLIDKLVVYPEKMAHNLNATGGLHNSQRLLLALTQAGMSREDAYRVVQRCAMAAWRENLSFLDQIKADCDITDYLDTATLESLFDLGYHTKHVDTIFNRVFSAS